MEISKAEPACIQSFKRFLREVAHAIMGWTFDGKEFPFDGFDLEFMLLEASPDSISIWIYVNVGEAVRATFDLEIKELRKSFLRVEVLKRRLAKIRPELRESDRAKYLLDGCYGWIEIRFAFLHGFICNLSKAFGWGASIEKQQPDTPAIAQSDPFENAIDEDEVEEPSDDGLDRGTCSFKWNGELFRDLSNDVMDAIGLIESNYKKGRPTTKESLLKKSSQQSIGKLFRGGDAARLKRILIDSPKSVELPENGLKMARRKA